MSDNSNIIISAYLLRLPSAIMEEQPKAKMSKHVCVGGPILTSVLSDPLYDLIHVMDDEDSLAVLKGLAVKEVRSRSLTVCSDWIRRGPTGR